MKVSGILKAKGDQVEVAAPDSDLRLAVHRLATLGIGCLVVVGDDGRVEGVFSERDVVRALNRHGPRFLDLRVRDVMSRNPPTCSPADSLQHVMAVMTRSRQRHLPVVDDAGTLQGVVSIGDVVKHRLGEMELERDVLRDAYATLR
jgi:CBS domain-containing protein